MRPIARILDANANRAREALRVMEDFARFVLDDGDLSAALKSIRHDLRAVLDRWPVGWLETGRDTPGDVGTQIAAPREYERADVGEVVIAAGKRLSEALRALEEFAKVDPATAPSAMRLEALRYRGYAVEQRLHAHLKASPPIASWQREAGLAFSPAAVERARAWADLREQIGPRTAGTGTSSRGAAAALLVWLGPEPPGREPAPGPAEQLDASARRATSDVVRHARGHGTTVIVAGGLDDALVLGADGLVLLPPSDSSGRVAWSPAEIRAAIGRRLWIGRAVSSLSGRGTQAPDDEAGRAQTDFVLHIDQRSEPPGPVDSEHDQSAYAGLPALGLVDADADADADALADTLPPEMRVLRWFPVPPRTT